jgi:hypothetical protein
MCTQIVTATWPGAQTTNGSPATTVNGKKTDRFLTMLRGKTGTGRIMRRATATRTEVPAIVAAWTEQTIHDSAELADRPHVPLRRVKRQRDGVVRVAPNPGLEPQHQEWRPYVRHPQLPAYR